MSAGASFLPVAYGIDDITLGFDMERSGAIERLNTLPGTQTRRGKMLGEAVSWGRWSHLLGRSVAFWRSDTKRLYVQAKLAAEGELCAPSAFTSAVESLLRRMAVVGIVSYSPAWVTRMDVAVDADCDPADGKLLLDALEATRLPHGWRTTSSGVPRSTVYFRARGTERVYARAYCRNLKTKSGKAYGRIRLEAEQRFEPKACPLEYAQDPAFAAMVWKGRYAGLASKVIRLAREAQTLEITKRVNRGELTYSQGERVGMFLDLERLGVARRYYPASVYAARKREASKLGYSANDVSGEALEIRLEEMLEPYARAVEGALPATAASPRL